MNAKLQSILRWFNLEKGLFLAAGLWLLVAGLDYQGVPVPPEWGPPRVLDSPVGWRPVKLDSPPPVGEFLAGGDPFRESASAVAFSPGKLPVWTPPRERPKPRPKPTAKPPAHPPPPKPPKPPDGEKERRPPAPEPYDLPVRLAGRIAVGGGAGRTVFVVKEDGRYVMVEEGQSLPELGVRVVQATKSVVIVENEKGQRFRLTDLLRSRRERGGEGGQDGAAGAE